MLTGLARRARAGAGDPDQRAIAVAAGGLFLVWLVHTSVDWLHLIPGVTGFALCAAAVLVSPWRSEPAGDGRGRLRVAAIVGCADDESLQTYYVRAAAYARRNDYPRARATLLEAARREPHDFVSCRASSHLHFRSIGVMFATGVVEVQPTTGLGLGAGGSVQQRSGGNCDQDWQLGTVGADLLQAPA